MNQNFYLINALNIMLLAVKLKSYLEFLKKKNKISCKLANITKKPIK